MKRLLFYCYLFDDGEKTPWVKEGSKPICRYSFTTLINEEEVLQPIIKINKNIKPPSHRLLFTCTIIRSICENRFPRSVNQAAKLHVGGGEDSPPSWLHLLGILMWYISSAESSNSSLIRSPQRLSSVAALIDCNKQISILAAKKIPDRKNSKHLKFSTVELKRKTNERKVICNG